MFRLSLIALILIFSLGNAVKIDSTNPCFDQTPLPATPTILNPACQICIEPSQTPSIFTEVSGSSFCPSEACMRDACQAAWQGCQCPPTLSTKDKQAYRQLSPRGVGFDDVQCGNNVTNGKDCRDSPVCKDNTVYYVEAAVVKPPKPVCSCAGGSCKWSAGGCFKKCSAIIDWKTLRQALVDAFPNAKPSLLDQSSKDQPKAYSLTERLAPESATYAIKDCLKDMAPGSFCLIDANIPCANDTTMGRKSQINVTCEIVASTTTGEVKYTFSPIDTEAVTCGVSQCKNTTERTPNCVELKNIYRDQMVCNQQTPAAGVFTSNSAEYCLNGQWKGFASTAPPICSAPRNIPDSCKVTLRDGVPDGIKCPFEDSRVPVNPLCDSTGFSCNAGNGEVKNSYFEGCTSMPPGDIFDSCWLGNQTGILNVALCSSKSNIKNCPRVFPHGQQCIPQCPEGKIRTGAEGPYCKKGSWIWSDRRGNFIANPTMSCKDAPTKPDPDQPIPNQIPRQCPKGQDQSNCKSCTFNGNRLLLSNLRIGAPYHNVTHNLAYIDWPFCGDMKHLETAQILCSASDARLSGSEYVQCYNGELFLGGWYFSRWNDLQAQGVSAATVSCIVPGNTTKTPDPVLFCEDMDVTLFGNGFASCGKKALGSSCTATCKPGFIPFERVGQTGLGFRTYFTEIESLIECNKFADSARWEWKKGSATFSCLDTCRAQDTANPVAPRRNNDLAPGKCQAPFLCDGVCSLYTPDGVECSGPACKFDALNCPKRTSIENNKFFNYSVKVESFRIVVRFESKPARNTWLGIYPGKSATNRQFSWARHIGAIGAVATIDILTKDILSTTTLVNGEPEPVYSDLLTKDYEFRVFGDLVVDSAPIYTSGLCFGTACQGKVASHKIATTKDIMKRKNLHAVTQEIVDLLKPELHLHDRVEFNRRIDIIQKVEEYSEKGESPEDLWDTMYSHIEHHGDAKKYYEMTQIKKRSEQVQQTVWQFNAAPGRCLSENPTCQCDEWGNKKCNPSCNVLDCQFDGLDCGCLESEMFNENFVVGVVNTSFTSCNQKARGVEGSRYYPVGTVCEVRCSDGRVAPGGNFGKLQCSADLVANQGGRWSHTCSLPCVAERVQVFKDLKLQFVKNSTLLNIITAEEAAQNFKDCNANQSSGAPYEPNRGICFIDCNNGLTAAKVRIECSPEFDAGLPQGRIARQWIISEPASIRTLMESKALCPAKPIAPPPPSPVPVGAPVKCPNVVPDQYKIVDGATCNDKGVGETCAVNCADTTSKKFGVSITCTAQGTWSKDVYCLAKCKVTDTGRNGPVEVTNQCEAYPTPGSPNSCDIGCGNNTNVGNLDGGLFYDGVTSCPKQMACSGASFSVNSTANFTIACLASASCTDVDRTPILTDRSATCNATINKFIQNGKAVIPDCGARTLDGKEGPVCYDDILGSKASVFRWLRSDGTGIKSSQRFVCVSPPAPIVAPVPAPVPSPVPIAVAAPVGRPQCTKDTLQAKYKDAARNWHLTFEYAVIGRYNNATKGFDNCATYTEQYPDGQTLAAFCDPEKSDPAKKVSVTCNGGEWVVPDCPVNCQADTSDPTIIINKAAVGTVATYSCVNPQDTVVFRKKALDVWVFGPHCVQSASGPIFQLSSRPTCVNRCMGKSSGDWKTGGTCDITSTSGTCDYFCDAEDDAEKDCLVPACKGISNTTLKCSPTKVSSIVAYPTKLIFTYSTTTPLPKNAHLEINELTSNNTVDPINGTNYFFFLPQIQFTDEELANDVMKSADLTIVEDAIGSPAASISPAIRRANFSTSKLQFTFYQDLSRSTNTKPLAQGNLCGGIGKTTANLCTLFTPTVAAPIMDAASNSTISPECAAGGCNCNQVGDGVCDLACLNPACKENVALESKDCQCYNPEYYIRGGSLTNCKPGESKEIGGACSYTCPDGSTKTTTCQVSPGKTFPTFSWNDNNCKRQCKSIPYVNQTWGGKMYIKYDNPDCNGITAPVNHGKLCFPECSVGTAKSNYLWFVCDDGEWILNTTSGNLGRESEYCSIGGKPCPWNDLLNSDKKIDDVMQDDKSFITGVTCVLQGSVTHSYTVVNSSKDQSISHGVTCQPQCKQGYDATGSSTCLDGTWNPKALGGFKCEAAKNCSYFDLDKYFSGGKYSCKLGDTQVELWRFNTTDKRPATRGTICSFECSSGYVLTPPNAQVQCSLVNGAPAWVTVAEKEPIFTKDRLTNNDLQNLYYPICHPGCHYGVPVNGQQRDSGNNLKCIGTPVFGTCAGWSCATGEIPYTRDVCSSKEPVCHHASFIIDTTDSGPASKHAFSSVCTDMASCWKYCIQYKNCSFADFESPLRVWAVPFTSSSWHRKLPYCFAPCNAKNLTRPGTGFKCSTKSGNYIPHGKTCDIECDDKNAIWTVQVRGTVVGAYNDFPVCYDGVFRGNDGRCVNKSSATVGADLCRYSDLNQVLREQKLLGFKCEEVNKEGAKFTTTCEPGYSMTAGDISDSTLSVECKSIPLVSEVKGLLPPNFKLFRWAYSIGTKELQYFEIPKCQKARTCRPLLLGDMPGAVADAKGIVCQQGNNGEWCSVKCQDGFIPFHTPDETTFQSAPGMFCDGTGEWKGNVKCAEGCADLMECLPNVAAKAKYTYKCDGVCQGNFIGDLDAINCAGPACNYDAAPDTPASKTCADNLFGATIEDTRAYSFKISIPEGKRLTTRAWVGFYVAGEPDNQKYLDRYELRMTHALNSKDFTFSTSRKPFAKFVGGDKATEYEVRVFPDVAWDSKPLTAVKITKNGVSNVSGGAAAAPASGSGPWIIIAVIFIVLFIITLIAAIALFLKLRGAQSSSDNQYSKYTERL